MQPSKNYAVESLFCKYPENQLSVVLFVKLEVVKLKNFNQNGLHQGDLLEKFKEKNLAKVSFLKLQTKENFLECFH